MMKLISMRFEIDTYTYNTAVELNLAVEVSV